MRRLFGFDSAKVLKVGSLFVCLLHLLLAGRKDSLVGHISPNRIITAARDKTTVQQITSSGELYSTISVHKLLHLIVPRFCWLDLRLQLSLYNMYGVPVSVCDSIIAYHNF